MASSSSDALAKNEDNNTDETQQFQQIIRERKCK